MSEDDGKKQKIEYTYDMKKGNDKIIELGIKKNVATEIPYSYHTFIFPFYLSEKDELDTKGITKWKENLRKSEYWKTDSWPFENRDGLKEESIYKRKDIEIKDQYALYQYLNPAARKAVFNEKNCNESIVENYIFTLNNKKATGKYTISKENKDYKLDVNAIKLKVFNTNVAILILELENKEHRSIKEIKLINEYGRRLFSPFLPNPPGNSFLCADELKLELRLKIGLEPEKFKQNLTEESENGIFLNSIPEFIKQLLSYKMDDISFALEKNKIHRWRNILKKNKIHQLTINPAIDDRMFVICLIYKQGIVNNIRGGSSVKGEYRYLSDIEVSKWLYSILFVDPYDATCQNKDMCFELLKKHVYERWIDEGTIYAVTHHSMMCISYGDIYDYVIFPFICEYTQLAILVIAQRASIIQFSDRISKISNGFSNGKEKINRKKIEQIKQFQEKYIAFQNQIQLSEVTPQEQGVEIYDMLLDSLYINKEKEYINEQMQQLYEIANIHKSENLTILANIIACIALSISILALKGTGIKTEILGFINSLRLPLGVEVVLLLVVAVVLLVFLNRISKWKFFTNLKSHILFLKNKF